MHQRMGKGDYGFNVFHNSNPQHGGSYARHERRMRDDEVEDFLKSVKHWTPVYEDVAENDRVDSEDGREADVAEPPTASPLRMGEEAIMRTFTFDNFRDAYLFMGRVWAFCYGSDKYPHLTWEGTSITVYLYSPSFRGLSKREARVAAFLNDQYNMARKSKQQQRRIVDGIVQNAAVEEMVGHEVAQALARRHARRTAPLREVVEGPLKWSTCLAAGVTDGCAEGSHDTEAVERERDERESDPSDMSARSHGHRQHPSTSPTP
jgi:pterin-4a-carbinolamine dehydratase